jgi:hypothetical protein
MDIAVPIAPLSGISFGEPHIQNGVRVFVRVLERAENGKFLVSFGGRRFFAAANAPLTPGTAFPARILARNGRVELVPLPQTEEASPLARVFESLGLPVDSVSALIVQFFQQYGFKFEGPLADKARRLARQFPGREEDAAEGALYLAEKGIEPDAERLAAFLGLLGYDGQERGDRHTPYRRDDAPAEFADETSFMEKLYQGGVRPESANPGLLTLANHLVSSEKHWITLPFTLPPGADGVIRILLDAAAGRTERIEIRARFPHKTWYIMVRYAAFRPAEVLFCADPEADSPGGLEKTLAAALGEGGPPVRYAPEARAARLFTRGGMAGTIEAEG